MRRTALKYDKCYFVITKPNAGDGVNEQGGVPNTGAPKYGEPQVIDQGMMEVVVEMLPHPDNILVDAYTQLLAIVEELKEVVDEQQREIDVQRELVAKQVEDNIEDLEDAWDFVKEQKEFKELTAEDMVKANEWLRQQGGRRYKYLY